ncbi:unnamed protein product [Aphanomyces euteiches]
MSATVPSKMRAVGLHAHLPIEDPSSLLDLAVDVPTVSGYDILVHVKAISVNPIDFKQRRPAFDKPAPQGPKILGYDAAGVVVAVGSDVTLFKVGDEVYYAGSLTRQGTNAEYHAVDERIVGRKPKSLSFSDAAALPLTSITAWEAIFHRLEIPQNANGPKKSVLIFNGAGGVDIPAQLKSIGIPQVDYILAFTDLPPHFDAIVEVIKPQGKICAIATSPETVPIQKLFSKSVTFVWELMFTRPIFVTEDIVEQHNLLNQVSDLVDAKSLRTTVGEELGTINAANLKKAHAALESGRVVGKLVLTGF